MLQASVRITQAMPTSRSVAGGLPPAVKALLRKVELCPDFDRQGMLMPSRQARVGAASDSDRARCDSHRACTACVQPPIPRPCQPRESSPPSAAIAIINFLMIAWCTWTGMPLVVVRLDHGERSHYYWKQVLALQQPGGPWHCLLVAMARRRRARPRLRFSISPPHALMIMTLLHPAMCAASCVAGSGGEALTANALDSVFANASA